MPGIAMSSPAPQLFDRPRIARHLQAHPPAPDNFVMQRILEDLALRLGATTHTFDKAALLSPVTAPLPDTIGRPGAPVRLAPFSTLVPHANQPRVNPDALKLPETDYSLIVSLFDLAILDDVPGFLRQIRHHLAPDGLFLAAFVGGTSFQELRAAWLEADARHLGGAVARIPPFIETKDAGSLLQRAGFALPVTDKDTMTLRYRSAAHLMHEIRAMGAAGVLAKRPPVPVSPAHLKTVEEIYARNFSDPDQ
ncbi:MAG TPA: SAM-dependent methyltransferase, partial [Devosia sp.]|nr:SAM-dependent methyltransferase [Devosia sp.]